MEKVRCAKCGVDTESVKTTGDYLGYKFPVELQGCPVCGKIYVPEDLVRGKIAEVESALEQK